MTATTTRALNGVRRDLFVASVLALFVELVLIRWVPSVVHVVGFFANIVLIASFLGLGVGMMRRREGSAPRAVFRLGVLVGVLTAYRITNPHVALGNESALGINEVAFGGRVALPLPLILVGVFALVAWTLVPYGRLVAGVFDELERIPAYTINIAGSLAGVALFTVMSAMGTPSFVWFAVTIGLVIALGARFDALPAVLLIIVALGAVYYVDSDQGEGRVLWSPYNQLRLRAVGDVIDDGFIIDVNNQFLLSGFDLTPDADPVPGADDNAQNQINSLGTYYDFPFEIAEPQSALILGAGAGNDIAAAKRAGVAHITAVEIDRRVAELGRDHHPEQPHDNIDLVIDDARSYLRSAEDSFDLVLFATLDAHGLLSSSSSVRLDSFVYTIDSLRDAKELVADDGVLVLSFGPFREEVQLRQYAMMEDVFGEPPLYFTHSNDHRMLVAGAVDELTSLPDGWSRISEAQVADGFARFPDARRPATDDWPHLYIRSASIPAEYIITLVGIALVGLIAVRREAQQMTRSDIPFFFLGAAFLLMETKSITEFALLIGSTWRTNALVFTVILAIILLANVAVHRGFVANDRIWFGVILASLVAHYLLPVSVWPEFGVMKLFAAGIYLGVPIFAAGVVFAKWFSVSRVGSVALGVNLLGSVVGGTLEYGSLLVGIRALALVALALYLAAFATRGLLGSRVVAS